jgi:hypothetical protein
MTKALIGPFCNVWGIFCIFLGQKPCGHFCIFFEGGVGGGYIYLGEKSGVNFVFFWGFL